MPRGRDTPNAVRRHVQQRLDQVWAVAAHRLRPGTCEPPAGDAPRIGIVTVNASTTRYLKLMLRTLVDQADLGCLTEIVVVDHGSRDGGRPFLRALDRATPRVRLVELRNVRNHARGLRAGERALGPAADVMLFCDPDVVWRDPGAFGDLAASIAAHGAAVAGEARRPSTGGSHANPDIQASFLAVRRDVLHRRDVRPPVNHGSPMLWLQGDAVRAGLPVVHFPSNHGGHILHRGRSAVAAARAYTPWHAYATAPNHQAHFMGVPDGAAIWAAVEDRYANLLAPDAEADLVALLAERLNPAGSSAPAG